MSDLQPSDLPCYRHPQVMQFRPSGGGDALAARIDAAKALCAACPVTQRCLDRWMSMTDDAGEAYEVIVGGTTVAERNELRRGRLGTYVLRGKVLNMAPIDHGGGDTYKACKRRNGQACAPCREAHAALTSRAVRGGVEVAA